jgi:hypothetical protein
VARCHFRKSSADIVSSLRGGGVAPWPAEGGETKLHEASYPFGLLGLAGCFFALCL